MRLLSYLSACLVASTTCLAIAGGNEPATPTGEAGAIVPAEDKELLAILAKAERAAVIGDLMDAFNAYPKERRLSAVAYALERNIHRGPALSAIRNSRDLQDKRLAKGVALCVTDCKERELWHTVWVANRIPSADLVGPLIARAAENDYMEMSRSREAGAVEVTYNSVFAEAAEAIYKSTGGKIGIQSVNRGERPPTGAERAKLVAPWREWFKAEQAKNTPPAK